jgi:Mg2+/Co2+ transporter CorB
MSIIGSILIILACLAGSAFFSGSETALFRLRSHDLDPEGKESVVPADIAVRDLTSSSSRLLVTILLGNNVVNILGASVASGLAIYLLGVEVGIPLATVTMTVLVLIFAEILPKAVAARHPKGVSRFVGLPLYLFHQILRPVHGLFDRGIEPLVRRVTGGMDGAEHRRDLGCGRHGRVGDHGAADGDRRVSDRHPRLRPDRADARGPLHARTDL